MKRRSAPFITTGLALVAAVSLAACGSDDEKSDAKQTPVAGAETEKSSPSVSPSPSASAGVGRPKIDLPSDLTYTFDWPKTGDKKKDAVLSDAEQRLRAVGMAAARQKPADTGFRFYSTGEAAAGTQAFVQRFVDTHDRITGVMRYSKPNMKINDDGTAGFTYCEDQSKAYRKNVKTGKTKMTQGSKDDYILYNSRLRLNDQGVWVTEKLLSQAGSSACQP